MLLLTSSEAKKSLDERFGDAFDPIVECTRILPVVEFDRPIRGRNTARCHDEHEKDDRKDGQALDERHCVLNMAVKANPKDICKSDHYQGNGDICCQRHRSGLGPKLQH